MNRVHPKDGQNPLPKRHCQMSLYDDISKLEKLTKWFGFSFADPIDRKRMKLWRYIVIVYIINVALFFLASKLINRMGLMDDIQRYTYFGDVTALQPGNNLAILSIIVCWNLSAASILLFFDLVPSGNDWLIRVEYHLKMLFFILESSGLDSQGIGRTLVKEFLDKSRRNLTNILAITVVIFSVGGISFQVEGVSNHWNQLSPLFIFGWSVNFFVCCNISTVVVIISIAQFSLCAAYIESCFALIKHLLENILEDALISLKVFSKVHLCVVNASLEANEFWKSYLFFFYLLDIPFQVFFAYQIIYSELGVLAKTAIFTWFVGCLVLVLTLTLKASRVASISEDCFHPLYKLSTISDFPEVQFQAALFMQGLRGSSVAFSGGKFFIINYSILFSILTVVLTYFTIISGNSSSASVPLDANCICRT